MKNAIMIPVLVLVVWVANGIVFDYYKQKQVVDSEGKTIHTGYDYRVTSYWVSTNAPPDLSLHSFLADGYETLWDVQVPIARLEVLDAMAKLTIEDVRSNSPAYKQALFDLAQKGIYVKHIQ
jgi:hypothetical protein